MQEAKEFIEFPRLGDRSPYGEPEQTTSGLVETRAWAQATRWREPAPHRFG
jgi:hypothetical protein